MITLSPEIQSRIEEEMARGNYASADDMLRQALDALQEQREVLELDDATLEGIRRGLDDSAAGRVKSLADFERDFRRRHGIGEA